MIKNDQLFELIQTMSKSEKRFFKVYSLLHLGNKEYLRLFDAVVKQKKYDEPKIKKSLKIKGFPVVKNYLYNLILKSIRINQEERSTNATIASYMRNTEILIKRGLFNQAWKSLNKAKELSKIFERNPMLMEIYTLENTLISNSSDILLFEHYLTKNAKDIQQTIRQFENLTEYATISISFYYLYFKKGGVVRSKKEEAHNKKIIQKFLSGGPKTALSYKAKIYYYNVMGTFYLKLRDYKKAYETNLEFIKHLKSRPELFKEEQRTYIVAMNNLMNTEISLQKYSEVKKTINELMEIKTTSEINKVKIFEYSAPREIDYYIKTGKFKEGIKRIPELEAQSKLYDGKLNKYFEILLLSTISEFYFFAGDFSKSLYWNNKVILHEKIKNYEQFLLAAKMAAMLIQYEMGKEDLVEYTIRSNEKQLKKNENKYKVENYIIQAFKDLIKFEDKKYRISVLQKLRSELLSLSDDIYEEFNFSYFDFISWADKKIIELQRKNN